jgi:hypothetical protein
MIGPEYSYWNRYITRKDLYATLFGWFIGFQIAQAVWG